MCEHCHETRTQMLREIAELAEGEGELYAQMVEISQHENEDEREQILATNVAQGIAIRAAAAARCVVDGEFHGMPPSLILGSWAGFCMNREIEVEQINQLRTLFGMGDN